MALKLDNSLLDELGLGSLPETEKQNLLRHIYETLEMRVGMRLADQMSNEQLDEFEGFVNNNDDAGAFKWLETNFPNYKDVVNDEFEKLKAEVKGVSGQILAQAQAGAQVAPGPQPSGQVSQPGASGAAPQPAAPQATAGGFGQFGPAPTAPQNGPAVQSQPPYQQPDPAQFTPPASPAAPAQPYAQPGAPAPQQPPVGYPPQNPQYPQYQPPAGPNGQQPPQAA
jgi:hypothetical protein